MDGQRQIPRASSLQLDVSVLEGPGSLGQPKRAGSFPPLPYPSPQRLLLGSNLLARAFPLITYEVTSWPVCGVTEEARVPPPPPRLFAHPQRKMFHGRRQILPQMEKDRIHSKLGNHVGIGKDWKF